MVILRDNTWIIDKRLGMAHRDHVVGQGLALQTHFDTFCEHDGNLAQLHREHIRTSVDFFNSMKWFASKVETPRTVTLVTVKLLKKQLTCLGSCHDFFILQWIECIFWTQGLKIATWGVCLGVGINLQCTGSYEACRNLLVLDECVYVWQIRPWETSSKFKFDSIYLLV